jgi:hypothetical protein
MKCSAGNDNKITYNYQDVLFGRPSTASASHIANTSTPAAPVDVSSETANRTLVNSFHERTTALVISSEAITTQNGDSMTQKSSTGGSSRHTEQPHSTIVPENGTSERRENPYEDYVHSKTT